MRQNIIITQLGAGRYSEINYARMQSNDQENGYAKRAGTIVKTKFAFEAVLRELIDQADEISNEYYTLMIVGTEKSVWNTFGEFYPVNIDNYRSTLKGDGEDEELFKYGIAEKLNLQPEKLQVKKIIVAYGIDDVEQQRNFQSILNALQETLQKKTTSISNVRICFDISNGFRSLPMYIYNAVNYLAGIWKNRYEFELKLYYGMFEGKQKLEEYGEEIAPLTDLSSIDILMQWTNAVQEFRNYGSVKTICDMFLKHPEWNVPIDQQENDSLSQVFQRFDYATNANNLYILQTSIQKICSLDRKKLSEFHILTNEAVELLSSISEEFKERFENKGNPYKYAFLTIRLAKWYFDQGRIGSASIAVQEGLETYLMERFGGELQRISGLQLKNNEEISEKDVFDYNHREPIKKKLFEDKAFDPNAESLKNLVELVELCRKDIRNTNAHIKYSEITDGDIQEYNRRICRLITIMEQELDCRENTDSVFYPFIEQELQSRDRNSTYSMIVTSLKNHVSLETIIPETQTILSDENYRRIRLFETNYMELLSWEEQILNGTCTWEDYISSISKDSAMYHYLRQWALDKMKDNQPTEAYVKQLFLEWMTSKNASKKLKKGIKPSKSILNVLSDHSMWLADI